MRRPKAMNSSALGVGKDEANRVSLLEGGILTFNYLSCLEKSKSPVLNVTGSPMAVPTGLAFVDISGILSKRAAAARDVPNSGRTPNASRTAVAARSGRCTKTGTGGWMNGWRKKWRKAGSRKNYFLLLQIQGLTDGNTKLAVAIFPATKKF